MDRVSAVQDGVHSPTSTDTTASGSILSLTPIAVFPRSSHSSASSFDPQRSHITLIENDSSIVTVPVVLPPTGEPGHQSSGSDDDDRKGRSGSNSESGEGGGESVDAREETARGLEERLESRTFALDPRGYVRSAKFSEGSKFLAVLRSAKSIEFFRVEADRLTAVSEVVRNTKSSDAILGFEWTFDSEMILLTNTSFDFYKYSESRRTFVQRKSFPVPISWYRYSPEHHILVLSTSAASLYLFQIKPSYTANQLPSLKVISSKDGRASITKRQLSIITIHARVYCAFIYSKPQDPVILLFRLTKTSVRPEFELMLEQDGNYLLSTVDDLLVVHNLTAKHSSVFDLLSPRLGLLHLPDSVNSATSSGKDWTTHPKSLVFCPSRGALFRLALSLSDLYAVLDGSRAPLMPVIEFLLRRSPTFNVTMLLAKLMRKIISAESEGMRDVRTVFEMVFADGEGGTSVAGSGGG
ncbi:hypothetical protein DFJ73DRAFT_263022 [Zopfochytrium polystomum]|nr:hypothetical protein DFJ73DRAFT_263022 [Zopfochytrium polystomum]